MEFNFLSVHMMLRISIFVVGLKVASKLFPLGLITGLVPAEINPANKGKPAIPADKQMFTREDVFSLLEQTEVSEDKNSASKFIQISCSNTVFRYML